MLTAGSGAPRALVAATCAHEASAVHTSLNRSRVLEERGVGGSSRGVFSVSKQQQPVTSGWRAATGCLCQEEGHGERRE